MAVERPMRPMFPAPTLHLSRAQARRFQLAHQGLWPPRGLAGIAGIQAFVRHVGCIQYDPINVVGRNPDLVLHARVNGYRPGLLEELLYVDRLLWDGWDKMGCIYAAVDWPFFARHRAHMVEYWGTANNPGMKVAPQVKEEIRQRGPLCSNDLEHNELLQWTWGTPTRLSRAALETLHSMGELGIHHRLGTRRYFDLIERLLPADVLAGPDPNQSEESYQDWHVLRRVGGFGLAVPSGGAEAWLGILGVKAEARRAILARLVERGELLAAEVEGIPATAFLRTGDLATLDSIRSEPPSSPAAAFVAPLDNLLWDRQLLRWLFGFDYVWEVYKPADRRKYGYYVLPVLYGDRFVARFDPAFDKRARQLVITNWWWEEGVEPDEAMEAALAGCLREFVQYLGATGCRLGTPLTGVPSLRWARDV
jgi:uncharacterized protein